MGSTPTWGTFYMLQRKRYIHRNEKLAILFSLENLTPSFQLKKDQIRYLINKVKADIHHCDSNLSNQIRKRKNAKAK